MSPDLIHLLFAVFFLGITSHTLGQRTLTGSVTTDSEITIGVSLLVEGTVIFGITDLDGDFEIENVPEGQYLLIVNPCCTCYVNTAIRVADGVENLAIDCNCKKNKAIVQQAIRKKGKLRIKKLKVKIGSR